MNTWAELATAPQNPLHAALTVETRTLVALAILEHPAGARAALKERRP